MPEITIDTSILCNPYVGEPLTQVGNTLVGKASGQTFEIRHGIPVILDKSQLSQGDRLRQWVYDRWAGLYDATVRLGSRFNINKEDAVRKEIIANLPVKSGDRVLETAIGTASNLAHLPPDAEYYGHDLSWNMLRQAQKNLIKWDREAKLFQGDGAYLPFHDSSFDMVYHMGGLQFYSDPFRGVSEMARVAKPGTTIIIIDEASGAQRTLRPMPAHTKYAKTPQMASEAMNRLVPHSMQEVTSEFLADFGFYLLSFKKPV